MNSKKVGGSRFLWKRLNKTLLLLAGVLIVGSLSGLVYYKSYQEKVVRGENVKLKTEIGEANDKIASLSAELALLKTENEKLLNEDLRLTNKNLKGEIDKLKQAFISAKDIYTDLIDLRGKSTKMGSFDSQFASILNFLGKDDLQNAINNSKKLADEIDKEIIKLASIVAIPANVPEKNSAPNSGYSRQKVQVNGVYYMVDIIAADLNSTKVIVDTASDGTCANDCPVLPLATYVSRSGAYAGVNGTYFCPDTYPDCASKKNTFDVLVMNKNKVYFNSDNNVYSSVPVAVFSGNSSRFIPQSKDWGRDTGVDAVIANRPLLVYDGKNMFNGSGENKEGVKSNRSFLGASGNIAYIGVVRSATVAEAASVLTTLGIKNAINLDSGGSTALWSGGYKAGPGRNLPNAVLFVMR